MDTKITLEIKDSKSKIAFKPTLDNESFVPLINNALNTMPQALLNLLITVPILRPACALEKEHNIYVFQEGDQGKVENDIYKYRKHLYSSIAAVFSQLLSTAFPDIEYIESCKQYQQSFCLDHTEEEVKEYHSKIDDIVKHIRENFDEVLKEVTSDEEKSKAN